MFAYVKGIVENIAEDSCVVDVHDIGIRVYISGSTAARMPGIGEVVKLYTYTLVKEDAFQLYGFLSKGDLEMFKSCITVSGIGPKGGLALQSALDADSLRFAILSQDVKAISKAPGIGKRTAERLILELKDKISIEDTEIGQQISECQSGIQVDSAQKKEAVEALVALGYGQTEATKAVSQVENADSLEAGALLKAALKKLF